MKTPLIKLLTVIISTITLLLILSCSEDNNPVVQNNFPPDVTIVTPLENSNYIEGNTISFSATVTDPEDGVLNDSSVIWSSNIEGQIGVGSSIQFDSLSINTHIIILVATDSKGAVGTDTVTIVVVQNYFPVVTIISPADSLSFNLGDTITFNGSATDLQDGVLSGNSLVWVSNIDGVLGTGNTLMTDSLSANKHVITLTATDSNNNSKTDQIVVFILSTFMNAFDLGSDDAGNSVIETSDGNFMIAGSSFGFLSASVKLLKISSNGDSLWTNTYGVGGLTAAGNSIIETTDGNYVIAGTSGADVYLFKINTSGTLLWEKTFGGSGVETGKSVKETPDGGFIIAGSTESYGSGMSDVYVIKTNSIGDTLWTKTFGGTNVDVGNSIIKSSDNGYIITGYTTSLGAGAEDVYLIKIDNNGNLIWEKTYGGVNIDMGYSVTGTFDGGFIIAGMTNSKGAGAEDVYLIKTDSNGVLDWEKTFGGAQSEIGLSLIETYDGSIVMTGYSSASGIFFMKTDNNGNLTWDKSFGSGGNAIGSSVIETSTNGYVLTGMVPVFKILVPSLDVLLIKTDSDGIVY